MLDKNQLKDLLNKSDFNNLDKLLLILASDGATSKSVSSIREIGKSTGLRAVAKWNVSSYLGRSKGLAISTDDGWELTSDGMQYVASIAEVNIQAKPINEAESLRKHLSTLTDPDTRAFVEEGIACFENQLY
ncbi:MAG: hypothetical protein AAF490_31940, partial [Chloroflexota bacterium]